MLPFKSDKDIGVVHGDIKPQNVLVFKDAITREITVKVTEFGYSTFAVGESGKFLLPKSRPWNAPEHHFAEFEAQEAKRTDVYSISMLCLWLLFECRLSDIPQTAAGGTAELISFNASPAGRLTLLERLMYEDSAKDIADHLMESMPGICLKEIFSLTLPLNPGKRTNDLAKVIGLLSEKTQVPKSSSNFHLKA